VNPDRFGIAVDGRRNVLGQQSGDARVIRPQNRILQHRLLERLDQQPNHQGRTPQQIQGQLQFGLLLFQLLLLALQLVNRPRVLLDEHVARRQVVGKRCLTV
jgi:hypothetical protein